MGETKNAYRILVGKPEGKRPLGRPRRWWVDSIKIVITKEKPATKREDINLFQGEVDEPIYSGFQTKFYVKVMDKVLIRVIKQHAKYSDEGPDIIWKDRVYISWSANDGYIVGIKDPGAEV
jgi:ABC-type Fe3+/spermidine/putrescine transport system ATPase subunit